MTPPGVFSLFSLKNEPMQPSTQINCSPVHHSLLSGTPCSASVPRNAQFAQNGKDTVASWMGFILHSTIRFPVPFSAHHEKGDKLSFDRHLYSEEHSSFVSRYDGSTHWNATYSLDRWLRPIWSVLWSNVGQSS